MLLPGMWVALRIPFLRVTCSSRGLTNHGLFRTRTFSRDTLLRVDVGELDSMVATAYAPDLVLKGDSKPFMLTQLASYGTKRVAHQKAAIERWLATDTPAAE
jgi:hypothetical protein